MATAARTLVFGGSYFLGRRMVSLLQREGHDVSVLNRGSRPVPGTTQLTADRDDYEALRVALSGAHFDLVVDFSCYTGAHAALALSALGGRFRHWVHVSTAAVYRDNEQVPTPEGHAVGGHPAWGDYGREKTEAEAVLRHASHADRITILRFPYVYGPENSLERETFLWSRLLRRRAVLVPGTGETVIQFLHVDDVARAIDAVARKPSVAYGKTYNVGEFQATTLAGWVRHAAAVAQVDARIVQVPAGTLDLPARKFFPLRDLTLFVDPTCLGIELGFRPRFDLRSGLAHTLASHDLRALRERPLDTQLEDRLLAELGHAQAASTSPLPRML